MIPCQDETGYNSSQALSELQQESWPCWSRFGRHFGIPPTFENMHVDPNLHPKMKMQRTKPQFDPGINYGSKFCSKCCFLLAIKKNILEMFRKHFENKAGRLKKIRMHNNLIVGVFYRCQNNSSIPYILDMFLCISVCWLEYWTLGFNSCFGLMSYGTEAFQYFHLDEYGDWSL